MDVTRGRRPIRRVAMRWLPGALVVAGLLALGLPRISDTTSAGSVSAPPAGRVEAVAPPPASPSNESAPDRDDRTADRLHGPHLPASAPLTVHIPTIGVSSPLAMLGLAEDGTLEPPGAPEDAGWFTGSVTPGAVGPAVLAGHVTWNGSAAVFFELATLRRDDRVLVGRADGRTAVFEVTEVRRFSKAEFPTRLVYGPIDHAGLRLITCGGQFDAGSRRYRDNIIVFGRLVAVRGGSDRP